MTKASIHGSSVLAAGTSNAFRPGLLITVTPWQHYMETCLIRFLRQFTPVVFRPVLSYSGGIMGKNHTGLFMRQTFGKLVFGEQKLTLFKPFNDVSQGVNSLPRTLVR